MRYLLSFYRSVPSGKWQRRRLIVKFSVGRTYLHSAGLLFNWRAFWIGWHYSPAHKRLCINLLPCLTVWYVKPGGMLP